MVTSHFAHARRWQTTVFLVGFISGASTGFGAGPWLAASGIDSGRLRQNDAPTLSILRSHAASQ